MDRATDYTDGATDYTDDTDRATDYTDYTDGATDARMRVILRCRRRCRLGWGRRSRSLF